MQIFIKADLIKATKRFGFTNGERLDMAIRNTLNDVAFQAKKDLKPYAEEVFDNPVALTKNPALVDKAVKVSAHVTRARLWLKDPLEVAKGIAPTQYLKAQIEGGTRADKRSEKLLRMKGILPEGKQTIIDEAYQNQHGNITGGMIQRILSDLQAYMYTGSIEQNRPTYFYKRMRGRNKYGFYKSDAHIKGGIARTKGRFFVLPTGIYERKRGKLQRVIGFIPNPTYTPRYNFRAAASNSVLKNWRRRFTYNYARATGHQAKPIVTTSPI